MTVLHKINRFVFPVICWALLSWSQAEKLMAQNDASSLQGGGTASAPDGLRPRQGTPVPQLPNSAGQYWQEYDLRPYTKELNQVDRPHQAIVDWILRETGTDAWFTEPFGFLNADRDTLRVYHNEQMHEVVRRVHERFVNGTTATQLYGARLMSIGNPNWRTRAQGLMRSEKAQSPGVKAYLVSKENSALLLALLRGRPDFRELNAVDLVVHNGQSQSFEQLRGRNYVENQQPVNGGYPPYMPVTGELKEGYRLKLSPLLTVDRKTVDLAVKCDIDQVERLSNVNLDLPTALGQPFSTQIQIPQMVSWRLHERFTWPADQVLILSCGIVATPQGAPSNTLLGQGGNILGLDRILPIGSGDRAEALLLIEHKGDATGRVASAPAPGSSTQQLNPLSRGRY
jgi:hypothetical protein